MPWYDLPLEQLREYRTVTAEPEGLDAWWAERIAGARALAKPVTLTRHQPDLYGTIEVYDAEFSGADGDRIKAWYITPGPDKPGPGKPRPDKPRKIMVTFIGYGGGRGAPAEHILLPALGYAVFVMDTRGQGGRWTFGATADGAAGGAGPENSLVMTRGVTSPETYYYTRLFTDAVLAVDAAREVTGPDATIGVRGASQGGGLALAAAALHGGTARAGDTAHTGDTAHAGSTTRAGDTAHAGDIAVCHADVPFLCDIQRAITLAPHAPYTEIPEFLSHNTELIDPVLNTLRYVDCALLARRVTAPTLVSVSLMDPICPPSTVFAAYNEIPAAKDIAVYPFSQHDVPRAHTERQLAHLRAHLPAEA